MGSSDILQHFHEQDHCTDSTSSCLLQCTMGKKLDEHIYVEIHDALAKMKQQLLDQLTSPHKEEENSLGTILRTYLHFKNRFLIQAYQEESRKIQQTFMTISKEMVSKNPFHIGKEMNLLDQLHILLHLTQTRQNIPTPSLPNQKSQEHSIEFATIVRIIEDIRSLFSNISLSPEQLAKASPVCTYEGYITFCASQYQNTYHNLLNTKEKMSSMLADVPLLAAYPEASLEQRITLLCSMIDTSADTIVQDALRRKKELEDWYKSKNTSQ